MPENLLQLEGEVENIVFRNDENGYTVLEIADGDEQLTAVGVMPPVSAGDKVVMTGWFSEHKIYGKQFSARTCEICRPSESADILRYLSSGAVRGIGPSTARRLVESFGDSTLDVMENQPERVAQLKGISAEKAQDFAAQLKANAGIRTLMLYLGEYGISNASAIKIFNVFGTSSVERIKENPYCLCQGDWGVSFERADFIAKKEQLPADSEVRVGAGLSYILRHNEGNGHTCLPKDKLTQLASEFLNVPHGRAAEVLEQMLFDRTLIADTVDDRAFVFTQQQHLNEMYIASRIKMMLSFPAEPEKNIESAVSEQERDNHIRYADLQKEAITAALSEGLLVLTGGPGTGKTTTLNAIIKILQSRGKRVLLAAPTGRAAQRMSALTGDEAKTLHRLLGVNWDKNDNPVFQKNEQNQLKCDALIIDEVSMVDSFIFASVMRALPLGCRLILVGDSDQLPSVGPGNVLGDLTDSGMLPVVRLNEIFRQAQQSLIVTNAHKIVNGQMPVLNRADKDFFFMPRSAKAEISAVICDLCQTRLPNAYGYSAFENIQVLSPSRKGDLGTVELNEKLQGCLNPPSDDKAEATIGGKTFREGDKVMQTKNDYDILWTRENGETGEGVFNGDIGIIEKIDRRNKIIRVHFDDKTANLSYEACANLDFSYAVTVHKSQGSEYRAVILALPAGMPMLKTRSVLYTAFTRARELLVVIGDSEDLAEMVQNDKRQRRYSGLRARLCGQVQ